MKMRFWMILIFVLGLSINGICEDRTASTYYAVFPHIAYSPRTEGDPNSSFWETILSIKNPYSNPVNVTLFAIDEGNNILATANISIDGHALIDKGINIYFPELSNAQFASLRTVYLEADGDVAVAERFEADGIEGGMQLQTVNAFDWDDAKSLLMSYEQILAHTTSSWVWWTGMATLTDTPGAKLDIDINRTEEGETVTSSYQQTLFNRDNEPVIKMAQTVQQLTGNTLGDWAVINPQDGVKSMSFELFGIHRGWGGSLGVMAGMNSATEKTLSKKHYILYNPRVDWTGVAVCNPNEEPAHVTVTSFIDGSSTYEESQTREVSLVIPAMNKQTGLVGVSDDRYGLPLGDMLKGTEGEKPALLVLESDQDIVTEVVQGDDVFSHNEGALGFTEKDSGYKLTMNFSYRGAENHSGYKLTPHETILQIANVGTEATDITFSHYLSDGSLNKEVVIQDVAPFVTIESEIQDIFGFGNMTGSIEIESGSQRLIGSYVLHSSDEDNGTIAQDRHRQSSMYKMMPVDRNGMELTQFEYHSNADNYVELGVETTFDICIRRTLGNDDLTKMILSWSDGSTDEFEFFNAGGTTVSACRQAYKTLTEEGEHSVLLEIYCKDNEKPKFREQRSFLVSDGMREIEPTVYKKFGEGDSLPVGVTGAEAGLEQNDSVSVYIHNKVDIDCDTVYMSLGDQEFIAPVEDGEFLIEGTTKLVHQNTDAIWLITLVKNEQTVKQWLETIWTDMPEEQDYDIDAIKGDGWSYDKVKNNVDEFATLMSLYVDGASNTRPPFEFARDSILLPRLDGDESNYELSHVVLEDLGIPETGYTNRLLLHQTNGGILAYKIMGSEDGTINSEQAVEIFMDFFELE